MTEAPAEDEECMKRPRYWRQRWRRQGRDNEPEESTMTTDASTEEYEHKDYKDDNRGAARG